MYHLTERTKLLLTLLPVSTLVFLLVSTLKPPKPTPPIPHFHIHNHLHIALSTCHGTLYPQLCLSTLASIPDLTSKSIPQIISITVNRTVSAVQVSHSNCTSIRSRLRKLDPLQNGALEDCLELLDETIAELDSALADLSPNKKLPPSRRYGDLQTLFSAAMTNQYTCLDGFARSRGSVRKSIEGSLYNITRLVSNSLAMLKKIPGVNKSESGIFQEYGPTEGGFPAWVSRKDRRLLQAPANKTKFDLVVAKDGSGNFKTVGEAVAAAPNSSATRFVIYIKAGAYFENVEVPRKKTMLMFVGDGIGKTVIKGNRNVVDGWTTFRSATVAVVGDNFIGKDLTIENYAGPSKHQAVALRSGSDFSAFYQCSFVGYQDTLYVHSLRQFYRECDVYGTVDFVFGNAAAVLQNCNLYARKPNENQKNIFTAQGREDPNQNTGISIISSKIAAAADLIPVKPSFKTYLGRPWKEYSRTVILQSYIDDLIDPAGWLEWSGNFALTTLYYGEYKNRGPGSNTSSRVSWPGYRVISNGTEASQFSVGNFIQGGEWLAATGVPFNLNLN